MLQNVRSLPKIIRILSACHGFPAPARFANFFIQFGAPSVFYDSSLSLTHSQLLLPKVQECEFLAQPCQ